VWKGKQVIASDWIDSSTAMSQPYQPNYGWLWWRLPTTVYSYGVTSDLLSQWSAMHGAPDSTLAKLQTLVGRPYANTTSLTNDIRNVLGSSEFATLSNWMATGDHIPQYRITSMGRVVGYAAEGWLGQYLVVYPELKIVAVRMRRAVQSDYSNLTVEMNGFPRFIYEVGLLGG
jgi:hypothetical protein